MYNVYSGLLRMFSSFQDDGRGVQLTYQMDKELEELKSRYELEKLIGDGDDFSKITALLQWESAHIYHKGNYDNHVRNTAVELFQYAYDKGYESGINCRSLSIALTECYLAVGIKARTVFLIPCSPYDGDNHVVCEAWCEKFHKWIMVDPTYGLYLMDKNGIPLNIIEIRDRLAYQKDLILSEGYHYNGQCTDKNEIITYYAKDFFYFQLHRIQGYDIEKMTGNQMITIAPNGFDVKKRILANIDYRIAQSGDSESMKNWRDNAEKGVLIYEDVNILE